jgi:predicted MPP superfamily phosphohydrolase
MLSFYVTVFGIYGAMHAYFLWRVWGVLGSMAPRAAAIGFSLLMMAAPVLVHLLERRGMEVSARAIGVVGYAWLVAMFWFLVLVGAGDLWNLLMRGASLAWAPAKIAVVPHKVVLAVAGTLIASGIIYGLWEAMNIRATRVTLEVANLPASLDGLRLVQVSDMHLGVHVGQYRTERMAELVRQAQPDVLVFTGDMVDGPEHDVRRFEGLLRSLPARLGKFAVLGNHEYYWGLPASVRFHSKAGLELLRGRWVQVAPGLAIAGVDDSEGVSRGDGHWVEEDHALPPKELGLATVLLKHKPTVLPSSVGRFAVQLSGHTHGGQIFPWQLAVSAFFPRFEGLYDLGQGSRLYVNRGAGTWGPRIRVFASPEIAVITLRAKPR